MEKALISELTQGMELVRQLGFSLSSLPLAHETHHQILQRILSNYEKCLFILQLGNIVGPTQPTLAVLPPETSCSSPEASPQSDNVSDRATTDVVHVSKKRKGQPVWTNQVRVRTENGLEGHIGDGYSWRKYGQKDILGAKYPRSYYRCTYRNIHDCWATKYLQRSDEDPYVFEITYRGNHSCNIPPQQAIAINSDQLQQTVKDNENSRANLRVNVDSDHISYDHFNVFPSAISSGHINNKPDSNINNNFSFTGIDDGDLSRVLSPAPTYISPPASSSSYFSLTQRETSNFAASTDIHQQNSESNPTMRLEQEGSIQFDNTMFFASYEKH